MKDGVQYVLRFGEVAGIDSGSDDEKKKSDSADKKAVDNKDKLDSATAKNEEKAAAEEKPAGDKNEKKGGLSRYILVMVQFNSDLLPKPELTPLPEIKKAPEKKSDGKADAKPADAKAADAKNDIKKDAKKDDAKSAGSTAAADSDDQEAIEEQRDRIEKENKRKQDAYNEKVKAGEQRAKELNARFADWYYVVGDETYRKIHLGQNDIIVKKKSATDTKDSAHPAMPKNPFDIPGLPAIPGQN